MISRATLLCGIRLGLFSLAAVAGLASPGWAQLQQVVIQTEEDISNSNTATSTYQQSFNLQGIGISSVTVTPPNGGSPFQLPPSGGGGGSPNFELDSTAYSTLQALQDAYPQGSYTFSIAYNNGTYDSASLLFTPTAPTSFVMPTSPLPLATAVSCSSPTFSWNPVSGDTGIALGCQITDPTGFYKLAGVAPYDIGETSWTSNVDLLPGTSYNFELSVYQGTASSSEPTAQGDIFTYYGVFGNTDVSQFTTAVPEPGGIALLLSGGLGLVVFVWRRRRQAA